MTVCGVLPADKTVGTSSATTVFATRQLFGGKSVKAGHAGTLDPLASGVLPVLLGEATSFARFLPQDKTYLAQIKFGIATDTDDSEGEIISRGKVPRGLGDILTELLPSFVGQYEQTAPAYSALKHQGRPMYYYARNKISAPPKKRQVCVYKLQLQFASECDAEVVVHCGAGFYVRSLARNLGERIGCGAHLCGLRRTSCASFDSPVLLSTVEDAALEDRAQYVANLADALSGLPRCDVELRRAQELGEGRSDLTAGGERTRLFAEGRFAGVCLHDNGRFRAEKMLSWTRSRVKQSG